MKKAVSLLLGIALLACVGIAFASPGGRDDPLVSKNYADTVYVPDMTAKSGEKITEGLETVYSEKEQTLKNTVTVAGFSYAEGFTAVTVPAGKYLCVSAGGSVVLTTGVLKMRFYDSKVIDVTAGAEVSSDGAAVRGHRYVTDTDSIAVYEAQSAATAMVKGFYTVSETAVKKPLPEGQVFRDVPKNKWFYEAVSYCYDRNIIYGVTPDKFDTESDIKRCDFICLLYRMNGEPTPTGESPFTDVADKKQYYYDAVVWCYENEIVSGVTPERFAPKSAITREQMMQVMYNYAEYMGIDMTNFDSERINTFKDTDTVSKWAREAASWATGVGVINGSGGNILPRGLTRRCEAAQVIYNFMKYLEIKNFGE